MPSWPTLAARTAALLSVLHLAAGCGDRAAPPQLAPLHRLVEGGDAETRVALGDDSRLVVAASATHLLAFEWKTTVPESGARTYALAWPPDVAHTAWVTIEPTIETRGGHWEPQPATLLGPDRTGLPGEYTLRFPGLAPGDATRVRILGRILPALEDRDVVTAPFVVPADAELRLGYAIEEAAWHFDSIPVGLAVEALAGPETIPLHAARLDPRRVEADRAWRDARVSLDALAGREVRLRLTARAAERRPGTSLPVWVDPRVVSPGTAPPRPGVVLILLDTVRAGSTTLGGSERDTTPTLAGRVAAEGVTFDHAVAPFPHTLPSHMSLFTGLYYARHRVRGFLDALDPGRPTFPEILRAAGWIGAAFTEDGFLIGGAGFQRGFSVYVENRSPDLHRPTGQGPEVFRAGLEWLERHADEPFLLVLHTYQAHWPYTPAERYRAMFPAAGAPPVGAELERLRYEQEIRHTDDLVASVLDGLARLGVDRRTLVVVTADHGEEFDEHGQMRHGHHLYDEAIGVPLAMRWPDGLPSGRRIDFPVSLVDVGPTILDLLGLPIPPDLDGRSVAPWIRDADRPPPDAVVFAQAPASLQSVDVDLAGVQTRDRKCIRDTRDAAIECYDLREDPGERAPLATLDDPATRAAVARLDAFLAGERPDDAHPDRPDEPLDPELERKLRALGYL